MVTPRFRPRRHARRLFPVDTDAARRCSIRSEPEPGTQIDCAMRRWTPPLPRDSLTMLADSCRTAKMDAPTAATAQGPGRSRMPASWPPPTSRSRQRSGRPRAEHHLTRHSGTSPRTRKRGNSTLPEGRKNAPSTSVSWRLPGFATIIGQGPVARHSTARGEAGSPARSGD